MLDNAIKYENEINQKFIDCWYNPKYKYYFDNYHYNVEVPRDDTHMHAFVSLNSKKEVIGYITYSIDYLTRNAHNFGAISFDNNSLIFGRDLIQVINDIFKKFNYNRLEYDVIIGNPIEKTYDKLTKKYGGRIIGIRKKAVMIYDGSICDDKIYEILKEDFMNSFNK